MRADDEVRRIADARQGVITRPEMVAAGLTRDAIAHRVRSGRLQRLHPGVYALGDGPLLPFAREHAALLACGPGSACSHITAAVLEELVPDRGDPIHITITGRQRRAPAGVILHRAKLEATTTRHGLPVTTPERTLLDLAATSDPRLPRALNEAQVKKLVSLDALLTFAGSRRGAKAIRALATETPGYTRAKSERRLLALTKRADLPRPKTNTYVAGHEVDALWPAQRLAVEVDGYATHATRKAFEHDRIRDADIQADGYRVLRISWDQLTRRPEAVAARLAVALRP